MQAVAGDAARWGETEHLLAGVIEAIQIGNLYGYVGASNYRFTAKPVPPKPIARPGAKSKRKRTDSRTQAQVDSVLAAWRDGGLPMVEQDAREVT